MAIARKPDEVVREFPAVGKYRIRVISSSSGARTLDIREYVSAEAFEGFTRRGVRLDAKGASLLADVIKDAVELLQVKP